jgi:hypothetical protein
VASILAAVIVQASAAQGTMVVTASGPGLTSFQQVISVHLCGRDQSETPFVAAGWHPLGQVERGRLR